MTKNNPCPCSRLVRIGLPGIILASSLSTNAYLLWQFKHSNSQPVQQVVAAPCPPSPNTAELEKLINALNNEVGKLSTLMAQTPPTAIVQETSTKVLNSLESLQKSQNTLSVDLNALASAVEQVRHSQDRVVGVAELDKLKSDLLATYQNSQTELENAQCAHLNKIESSLEQAEKKIAELQKSQKAAQDELQYLTGGNDTDKLIAMAREAAKQKKDDEAHVMYLSALMRSRTKSALLKEYVKWREELITTALKEKRTEEAGRMLSALAEVCDTQIQSADAKDMELIPEIKDTLVRLDSALSTAQQAQAQDLKQVWSGFRKQLTEADTYAALEALKNKLTATENIDSDEDAYNQLMQDIQNKQSCLTTTEHPLLLPDIDSATPWCAWIQNFTKRLQDANYPTAKKLEDIGTAAAFIDTARQEIKGTPDGDGVLKALQEAYAEVNIARWLEKAEALNKNSNVPMAELAAHIAEADEIAQGQTNNKEIESGLIELNKKIVERNLRDLRERDKDLKELTEDLPDDEALQFVSVQCQQYLTLFATVRKLQRTYPGEVDAITKQQKPGAFDALAGDISQALNGSRLLVAGLRKSMEEKGELGARNRFVDYAKKTITEAEIEFKAGEKVADDWFKTRAHPEAQKRYKNAWLKLMSIHALDLGNGNQVLLHKYNDLKAKIESCFTPTDADIKKAQDQSKHISDFREEEKKS